MPVPDVLHSHHICEDHCPACHRRLNATARSDGGASRPSPGDLSVCVHCGALLVFDSEFNLDLLAPEGFDQLPSEVKQTLLDAQAHIEQYARRLAPLVSGNTTMH